MVLKQGLVIDSFVACGFGWPQCPSYVAGWSGIRS